MGRLDFLHDTTKIGLTGFDSLYCIVLMLRFLGIVVYSRPHAPDEECEPYSGRAVWLRHHVVPAAYVKYCSHSCKCSEVKHHLASIIISLLDVRYPALVVLISSICTQDYITMLTANYTS